MSDDIVKRLRGWAYADEKSIELFGQMMRDAADEIERMRAALATRHRYIGPGFTHHDGPDCPCWLYQPPEET